jgi:hypothetical protein
MDEQVIERLMSLLKKPMELSSECFYGVRRRI